MSIPGIKDPYDDEPPSLAEKIDLHRFIHPLYIIAISSVMFYFIVSDYYNAYFDRLSIPFYSLDLPFTFYIANGEFIAAGLVCTAAGIFYLFFMKRSFKNKYIYFLFYLIAIFLALFASMKPYFDDFVSFIILCFILLIILRHLYSSDRRGILTKADCNFLDFSVVMLIICAIAIAASITADHNAEALMSGKYGFETKLDLKDNNSTIFDKTLIFIVHSDNKFYFIEKSDPIPKRPKLFVLSDDQLKMITFIPVQSTDTLPEYLNELYRDFSQEKDELISKLPFSRLNRTNKSSGLGRNLSH